MSFNSGKETFHSFCVCSPAGKPGNLARQKSAWPTYQWNTAGPQIWLSSTKIKSLHFCIELKSLLGALRMKTEFVSKFLFQVHLFRTVGMV